jgi:hypothetical protein
LANYANVSRTIQDVLWGYIILTKSKVIKKEDPKTFKKVADEWATEKTQLKNLLTTLQTFDNETDLDEPTTIKLEKHLNDPKRSLDDAVVLKASNACAGVNKWLKAQAALFWVNKKVRPLLKNLDSA